MVHWAQGRERARQAQRTTAQKRRSSLFPFFFCLLSPPRPPKKSSNHGAQEDQNRAHHGRAEPAGEDMRAARAGQADDGESERPSGVRARAGATTGDDGGGGGNAPDPILPTRARARPCGERGMDQTEGARQSNARDRSSRRAPALPSSGRFHQSQQPGPAVHPPPCRRPRPFNEKTTRNQPKKTQQNKPNQHQTKSPPKQRSPLPSARWA